MIIRYKIYLSLFLLLFFSGLFAQQTDIKQIRIADTLTVQEMANRNPIILKKELDSLIKQFNASKPEQVVKEPLNETSNVNEYIIAGIAAILSLLFFVIYIFYRHQQKINRTIAGLNEKAKQIESNNINSSSVRVKDRRGKNTSLLLESKVNELNAELKKLSKENEGLNRVIHEYNGIQHEYDSLKHDILKAYKVKNYPGYDKTKDDILVMQGVLQTENSVVAYAYEKFLKPILAITDANKNNPAKLDKGDQKKLLDMLVSLSLLYIEYLYLRVNDLSIGGKMVERIEGLGKKNDLDAALLKKLDMEFGSRALVVRIALNKAEVQNLSYPVFDETNLNHQ